MEVGTKRPFNASDTNAYIWYDCLRVAINSKGRALCLLGIFTNHGGVAVTIIVAAMLLNSPAFASLAQLQRTNPMNPHPQPEGAYLSIPLSTYAVHWNLTGWQDDTTSPTTRSVIMAYVTANPGVYLRELADDLDLSMGVVQYHTWALVRSGGMEEYRIGRFRRFFKAGSYQELEQKVISLLRQETCGEILTLLSKGQSFTHTRLAGVLGITSQALTWQIRRLKAMGVVESPASSRHSGETYSLPNRVSEVVCRCSRLGLSAFEGSRAGYAEAPAAGP
jgi:DNA-binding transcriptional ArsR family regulator